MNEKTKLSKILLNIIFPPVCACCGEIAEFDSQAALCPVCEAKFTAEKSYICPECHEPHGACRCVPKLAKGYVTRCCHVSEYTSDESVTRTLVLNAKRSNYSYLHGFISDEAVKLLKSCENIQNSVVTYVPRSRASVRETGVDQSACAARLIARKLGITCVNALKHRKSLQQKKLDTERRRKNAEKTYFIRENRINDIKGKKVILYDDVMTTGATLAACAVLLRKMGAVEIVCVTFAKTYKKF